MIDLNGYAEEALLIAEARQKNGASIKTDTVSMLKHCATEVVEAVEAYRHYEYDACDPLATNSDEQNIELFASELADVIMCVLIMAAKEGIDIEEALEEVQKKNRKRAEGAGDKL